MAYSWWKLKFEYLITINLAFDEEITKELSEYLTELGINFHVKESEIQINKADFDEKILGMFLEKTKREHHTIQKLDSNSFLISKIAKVEDIGLGTCEICGLVASQDMLFSHRWTHGA